MAGAGAAFLTALAWGALVIPLGPRLGFIDRPDDPGLKVHERAAIPLGGVGIFLGVHTGMAIEGIYDPGLSTATGGLLILGLLDDRFRLTPGVRLIAEGILALILVTLSDAGWTSHPIATLFGIVLVVGALNAVNVFDGLDGLVGTSGAVAALGLFGLAEVRGINSTFGLVVAAALTGFLILNWHPARVFLGDNGSYTVGAFLAYGIMRTSPEPIDSRVIVALVLLGVFALEMGTTVIRRFASRAALFAGDRDHLYDRLRRRGWTVPRVAITMGLVQVAFGLATLGIEQVRSGPGRVALVAGLAAASLVVVGMARGFGPQSD